MTREYKMTIAQTTPTMCHIRFQTRDDNGPWSKVGIIPVLGTVDQIRTERIANQIEWGWTLYDPEDLETLIFWKEI